MTNIVNFPERARIQEEASHWLMRLDGGLMSAEEALEMHTWLDSHEHRQALIELCLLWDNMEILSELSELFPLSRWKPPRRSNQRSGASLLESPLAAVTATAVLLVSMLIPYYIFIFQNQKTDLSYADTSPIVYETSIGEQKKIRLSDGSTVWLNTNTVVQAKFSKSQRVISLLRGEAYFQVQKESDRPFLVRTDSGIVQAVGTAFSVRIRKQEVEVTVTEGNVAIVPVSHEFEDGHENIDDIINRNRPLATLKAGQVAGFSDMQLRFIKTIKAKAISRNLLWQQGMVEFGGESLEEVIEEITRYTDTEIIIMDPQIRNMRIGGYFRIGEIEQLLAILEEGFQIRVNRINERLIYLTKMQIIQAEG